MRTKEVVFGLIKEPYLSDLRESGLFWSDTEGWGSLEDADFYPEDGSRRDNRPPVGCNLILLQGGKEDPWVKNPRSREVLTPLPHTDGLVAIIKIERVGQQAPCEGDGVEVAGSLYLPREPLRQSQDGTYRFSLAGALQFYERVCVGGEILRELWGNIDDSSAEFRKCSSKFSAPTWREAFSNARAYWEGELDKLIDALNQRHAALLVAEE